MTIRWTVPAIKHLARIGAYLSAFDRTAAERIIGRIDRAVSLLSTYPELGRRGRGPGVRELKISRTRYIVVYRLAKERVDILAVFHERQERPSSLPRPHQ